MQNQSDNQTSISNAPGSLQTVRASVRFLRQYPPYQDIADELLERALQHARLTYHAEGEAVIGPEDGVPDHFCVVQQGLVTGSRDVGDAGQLFESGPGDTFLNVALLERRSTSTRHVAAQDSFVIEIPRAGFDLLCAESPDFLSYCQRRAGAFVETSLVRMRAEAAADLQTELSFDMPLRSLARRAPVSCGPDTSVRKAVQQMHESEVSSMVIVDADQRPIGIFTLRDLRALVADGAQNLDAAIAQVMTPSPLMLDVRMPVYEAVLLMLQYQIGHILLVEGDRLCSVVSERDLFALKQVDMVQIARGIGRSANLPELRLMRESVIRLIRAMVAAGASSRQLTGIITRLNDAMVDRVIQLVVREWTDPVPEFSWLSFGSEARGEQTLATDQDNGMLFDCGSGSADEWRRALLPLAVRMNDALAQVGFPLCRGNIMASNPDLCLSWREWESKYRKIIDSASPKSLLHASIFLDIRALYGRPDPVTQLQETVLEQGSQNSIFLHALAADALSCRPPVGMFRDFVTRRSDEGKVLDLKKGVLQPFVGGTRVFAIAHRVPSNNTEDRLDALCECGVLGAESVNAWKEAFSFVQMFRLRLNQAQMEAKRPLSNDIDPYAMNEVDQRILKESLRQAQRLQNRLKLDYP